MRTIDQKSQDFVTFRDLADDMAVGFYGVYLTKLHMGEDLLIRLKDDSENEERPYIIEVAD